MQFSVGGQSRTGIDGFAAFEVGQFAARFFDDDFIGGNIPGLQSIFKINLPLPLRRQRITEIIPRPALAFGFFDQFKKAVPISRFLERIEPAVEKLSMFQFANIRNRNALTVAKSPLPLGGCPEFVRRRIVDNADGNFPFLFECNQKCPDRNAPDEIFSAVDGVDNPALLF